MTRKTDFIALTRKNGQVQIVSREIDYLDDVTYPQLEEFWRVIAKRLKGLEPEATETDLDVYDVDCMLGIIPDIGNAGAKVVKAEWFEVDLDKGTLVCTEFVTP